MVVAEDVTTSRWGGVVAAMQSRSMQLLFGVTICDQLWLTVDVERHIRSFGTDGFLLEGDVAYRLDL